MARRNDEDIIRDLVEMADDLEDDRESLTAFKLVDLYIRIDQVLGGRNPRKLLDSMNLLAEEGND